MVPPALRIGVLDQQARSLDPVVVRRAVINPTRPREEQGGDARICELLHLGLRQLVGQTRNVHRNDIA